MLEEEPCAFFEDGQVALEGRLEGIPRASDAIQELPHPPLVNLVEESFLAVDDCIEGAQGDPRLGGDRPHRGFIGAPFPEDPLGGL